MNMETLSTRRRFLSNAGAALSAPLAVAGVNAAQAGAEDHASPEARLEELEDVNAIRKLHHTYARLVNRRAYDEVARLFAVPSEAEVDPGIRGLSADRFGEDDLIELTADRRSATGRFHSVAEIETAIGPSCTLVEMARAQGEGFVRRSEKRVIEAAYVREAGVSKIRRAAFSPPPAAS